VNYYTDYKMVKTFNYQELGEITRGNLTLNPGDLSGDLISGGTISNFSSTGISDKSTKQTLVVEDDKITVKSISLESIESGFSVRGDVKVYGILDASVVRTNEIYSHRKYDQQFLEFANANGEPVNTGLLWSGGQYSRQFLFKQNVDRFFSSEHLDLDSGKEYLIDNSSVLSRNALGRTVVNSNLQTVGTLEKLSVSGAVNIGDFVHFNPVGRRFAIGTDSANGVLSIYDTNNNVELILSGKENNRGIIGTFNTTGLEIVTDHQTRMSIEPGGDITLGVEQRDSTVTRVYGKLSVGVKNPRESFEVSGNIRWSNKLFAIGNSAPTEGSFTQGDIVWNSIPKEGAYIGWVCISTGSPGQWKPFGVIAS
jgi:hypothetical protein